MGFFDGPPSSAALAAALRLPVVAVIDAQAIARHRGTGPGFDRRGGAIGSAGDPVPLPTAWPARGHARLVAESIRPPQRLWGALPRAAATLPSASGLGE